jgi:hypothetical protein
VSRRVALAVALVLASPDVARACGVSASGAPAGICDASAVVDAKLAARRNRVGVSVGYTSTVLEFSDGLRSPTVRYAAMASFEHPMKGWTFEIGLGSLAGGYLSTPDGRAVFSPGLLGDVSLSHLVVASRGYARPFLLLSFAVADTWAKTTLAGSFVAAGSTDDYVAFDFSATAAFGASLHVGRAVAVAPFLAGRLFGGPTFWTHRGQSVLGTDAYKYALGPGLAVDLFHRVGVTFGGSVVGEKSAKAGLSIAF